MNLKTFALLFLLLPSLSSGQNKVPYDSLVEKYYLCGKYDSALFFARKYETWVLDQSGKKDSVYFRKICDVGVLARYVGDFRLAEEKLKEAIQLSEEIFGKKNNLYAYSVNELGAVYVMLNNLEKAENCYLTALSVRKRNDSTGKDYANSLNNLSNLYRQTGRIRSADSLIRLAIPIIIKRTGENSYELGVYYTNLSKLLILQEKYEEAEPWLYKAIDVIKVSRGENHPYMIHPYNMLSEVYQNLGMYEKALTCATVALNLVRSRISEWHPDFRNVLYRQALIYADMGRTRDAMNTFDELLKKNKIQIERNFTFLSEKEKLAFIKAMKLQVNSFYSFAEKNKTSIPDLTSKVYDQELLLKGLLLTSGNEIQNSIYSSKDPQLLTTYEKLKKLRIEISKLYAEPSEKRQKNPASLEEEANNAEKELTRMCESFAVNQKSLMTGWQDVQRKLKKTEAAIEFLSIREKRNQKKDTYYYALVLTADCKSPFMIPLFAQSALDSVMRNTNQSSSVAFVEELYAPSRGVKPVINQQGGPQGYQIYKMIWAPIDSVLSGVQTIYYAPSGVLHTLAFAAIPGKDGKMLCEKYQLNCVGSTRQLSLHRGSKKEKFNSALIYGGIEYNGDSLMPNPSRGNEAIAQRSMIPETFHHGRGWTYLKGTLEEALAIEKITRKNHKVRLLTGSRATEESFKSLDTTGSPDIIHISSHGFFIPEKYSAETAHEPLLRSGLIMAGANRAWLGGETPTGCDDGILTAYEVSGLNLSKTKLVVLSACETGLGDIEGSEGVFGLQRAFKMASVNYIIMSLWQVPDKETVEFMKTFYQFLEQKKNVRTAFSMTQRSMRKKYEPYYWAAFVLVE